MRENTRCSNQKITVYEEIHQTDVCRGDVIVHVNDYIIMRGHYEEVV